jgi:peptide/nickel transport system permease protein
MTFTSPVIEEHGVVPPLDDAESRPVHKGGWALRRLVRRLGIYALTFWAAVSINFLLPRMLPGDPTATVVEQVRVRTGAPVPPETIAAIRSILGNPTEDLLRQYVDYWVSLFHLDFGISTSNYPVPVIDLITAALPWTILLVVTANLLSWMIGTGMGVVAGWMRGSRTDGLLTLLGVFAISVPGFWVAQVILWAFAYELGWFPNSGAYDPALDPSFSWPFISSVISHAALPTMAIVVTSFAGWLLSMRNMTAVTTMEDYVLLARAKGLPTWRSMVHYAGRNAILPNATGLAQAIGHSVGGVLLVEIVFGYPGLGTVLFEATKSEDLPLMQAIFLLVTVVVLFFNFVSDVVNTFIDPRTREGD